MKQRKKIIESFLDFATSENLLCYQCERKSDTECNENELLPCPSTSDRCVTYITKEGNL